MSNLAEWILKTRSLGMFGCGQAVPHPAKSQFSAGLWHEKFGTVWATKPNKNRPAELDARSIDWVMPLDGCVTGSAPQIAAYASRILTLATSRRGLVFDAEIASLSKFVTGTGIAHPIENGFAWHRTLGTPYLPGSGVKGLTLAYARDWHGLGQKDRALLRRIFGTAPGDTHKGQIKDEETGSQAGTVVFGDAIPLEPPVLTAQILTPHGSGSGRPEEAGKVIPNGFLAVKSGKFRFTVLPNPMEGVALDDALAHCRRAREWLKLALEWTGAGAKTKSNYGRFAGFSDVLDQPAAATFSATTS